MVSGLSLSFLVVAVLGHEMRQVEATRMLLDSLRNVTDLSNGAVLSTDISKPVNGTTYAHGSNVSVQGETSVGTGIADVTYIYIIDTSDSTSASDGACGSTLDCVQAFFHAFHQDAIADGSAKLAAVINFDTTVTVSAELQDPNNQGIWDGIDSGTSYGDTECSDALDAATDLVKDPSNTAGTTVVVFAGDGLCTQEVTEAGERLAETGAIVHSIAVGDEVNCTDPDDSVRTDDDYYYYYEDNLLSAIPQNDGECFSIPDPNSLPKIIEHIIGTNLTKLEIHVDGGNYTVVDNDQLPADGAVTVSFDTTVVDLPAGNHEICIRATGMDSLDDIAQVEDCRHVYIEPTPEEDKTAPPTIFLAVAGAVFGVVALVCGAWILARTCCKNKEKTADGAKEAPKDLELEDAVDITVSPDYAPPLPAVD